MGIEFFSGNAKHNGAALLPRAYRKTVSWLPQIGDIFPDFVANTTQGPVHLHDWAEGSWVFFFSHPAAFTPVCSTEIASFANAKEEFAARNVKVLGLSREAISTQQEWFSEIESIFDVKVDFPMIEDLSGKLAKTFGMVHPKEGDGWAIRKSFIIDPSLKVRMIFEYPVHVGRSSMETIRVIDALKANDQHRVCTPGDWVPGDRFLLPSGISDAEASARYGNQWEKVSDYLKVVTLEE